MKAFFQEPVGMRRLGLPAEQIIALHRCDSDTAEHSSTANRLPHKEREQYTSSAKWNLPRVSCACRRIRGHRENCTATRL